MLIRKLQLKMYKNWQHYRDLHIQWIWVSRFPSSCDDSKLESSWLESFLFTVQFVQFTFDFDKISPSSQLESDDSDWLLYISPSSELDSKVGVAFGLLLLSFVSFSLLDSLRLWFIVTSMTNLTQNDLYQVLHSFFSSILVFPSSSSDES